MKLNQELDFAYLSQFTELLEFDSVQQSSSMSQNSIVLLLFSILSLLKNGLSYQHGFSVVISK